MLRKMLRSLMEGNTKDVTNAKVAQISGICDATLSNFFNYKNELTISSWLLTIRSLAPEREDELVGILADEMIATENRLNCRLLMEYASTRRNFEMLSKLIESQSKAPKENKDWAEVYEMSLRYQTRQVNNEDLLFNSLTVFKPKFNETAVFAMLLKANVFYMLQMYKPMFNVIKAIEKGIAGIKNPYIKESYTARLSELLAKSYLYAKNDVKKARFYANSVINSKFLCPKFTSHMYHLLGTSFLFESYDESVGYFQRYYDILKEQNRDDLAEQTKKLDIFFAKVLWGQNVNVSETDDSLEKLHYYARNEMTDEFNRIYTIDLQEDPFALCYLGILNNSPESLLTSIAKFIEKGNKFFAELPRKEIAKYPLFTFSADVMCAINIA